MRTLLGGCCTALFVDGVPIADTVRGDASRRGQRVYDTWAEYGASYRVVDRLTRAIRERAVRALDPDSGEAVVDLGCGPGGSFVPLAAAVGPTGDVLGVDYSAAMVRSANDAAAGIPAASVLRGDAAGLPLRADSVDAVFASLALSAMPKLERVLDEIARVVRPGGRLVVVDGRVPDGPVGDALQRIYRRLVNFRHPDVLASLRTRFDAVTLVETFDAGLGFVARVDPTP